MKGDKAQTRPERRTPPLRETHEGRQMKADKAQTRPERRTPPLRETHEGRQMKGDNAQTRPERRTPPFTREGGRTIQHRHTCGETMRDNGGAMGDKTSGRRTHHPTQAHMWGDNERQWGAMGDKTSGRRTHHPTQAHMWGDNGKHWETRERQDIEKANTLSNTGTHVGRQRETSGDRVP